MNINITSESSARLDFTTAIDSQYLSATLSSCIIDARIIEYLKKLGCFDLTDYLRDYFVMVSKINRSTEQLRKLQSSDTDDYNSGVLCKLSTEIWQMPEFFEAIHTILTNTGDIFMGEHSLIDCISDDVAIEDIPSDMDTANIPTDKAILLDYFCRMLIEEGAFVAGDRVPKKLLLNQLVDYDGKFTPFSDKYSVYKHVYTVMETYGFANCEYNIEGLLNVASRRRWRLQYERLKSMAEELSISLNYTGQAQDLELQRLESALAEDESTLKKMRTDLMFVQSRYKLTPGYVDIEPIAASVYKKPMNQFKTVILLTWAAAYEEAKNIMTDERVPFWDWFLNLDLDLSEFVIQRDISRYMRLVRAVQLQYGYDPTKYPQNIVAVIQKPVKPAMCKVLENELQQALLVISCIEIL